MLWIELGFVIILLLFLQVITVQNFINLGMGGQVHGEDNILPL